MTEEALSGVGAELARARESQGLTLLDVAQQLKFAPRQIEALEQERFGALPGPTIARGMLRNYARLLKLDADAVLERVSVRLEAPDAERLAARFRQPVPFSDSARRSTLMYVGLSVMVLLAVAAMGYEWRTEREAASELAFVAAAKLPLEPRAPRAAPPAAPPAAKALEAVETAAKAGPQAAIAPQAAAAPVKAPAPAPAPAPVAGGAIHRLVLFCEEESWIEVTDARGRLLISALNPPGTERVADGWPPFSVVIGNAHHVQLTYDGEPVDLQPHIRVEVARFTLE